MLLPKRPHILYVEDHDDTLELVSILLNHKGIDVTTSKTLQEGNRLAQQHKFDLFLLDLWLPDGDGLDLVRQVRKVDLETPIIVFSAAVYESDQLSAMEAGIQAYLTKPAVPSQICNMVVKYLRPRTVVDPPLYRAKAS